MQKILTYIHIIIQRSQTLLILYVYVVLYKRLSHVTFEKLSEYYQFALLSLWIQFRLALNFNLILEFYTIFYYLIEDLKKNSWRMSIPHGSVICAMLCSQFLAGAPGLLAHWVSDPRGRLPGVRRDAPGVAVSRTRAAREDRLRPHASRGPRARAMQLYFDTYNFLLI